MNWRTIKSRIFQKFRSNGYNVKVEYTHCSGEHPVYYIKVMDDDAYAWELKEEIEDEYDLTQWDPSYTDNNGYRVWELIDLNN